MTSVQKFLRQRSQANTIFSAPSNTACYYVFIPTAGNYVGNYPPGYMAPADFYGAVPDVSGLLLRDMGKTIKCPMADTSGVLQTTATSGFFREIQLISPVAVASATASSNFGVIGNAAQTFPSGNVGDRGYDTLYVPIVIDGTLASSDGSTLAVLPSPYLAMGGQM